MINIGDWIRKWSFLQPHKIALIFEGHPFTYREINQRTNQLCHFLLELGIRKGDRVSVLLYNCHQYIEIFFALSKMGAILVPLNWRLAGPELEFIIKDSGSRMLIFEPEKVAKYKIPKYAEYIEELPKTASGKIQKFLLKEMHKTEGLKSEARNPCLRRSGFAQAGETRNKFQ